MLLGLLLVAVAGTIACLAAGCAGPSAYRREAARRERYLRGRAGRANSLDVERLLAEHLTPAGIHETCRSARALGIDTIAMWAWGQRFGAEHLVLTVRAGVDGPAVERHLAAGTAPDRRALELFAELNSPPLPRPVAPAPPVSATRLPRDELRRFRSLPPIMEPGLWPHSG